MEEIQERKKIEELEKWHTLERKEKINQLKKEKEKEKKMSKEEKVEKALRLKNNWKRREAPQESGIEGDEEELGVAETSEENDNVILAEIFDEKEDKDLIEACKAAERKKQEEEAFSEFEQAELDMALEEDSLTMLHGNQNLLSTPAKGDKPVCGNSPPQLDHLPEKLKGGMIRGGGADHETYQGSNALHYTGPLAELRGDDGHHGGILEGQGQGPSVALTPQESQDQKEPPFEDLRGELCKLCVHTPCLCLLLKLNMKIKLLQEESRKEEHLRKKKRKRSVLEDEDQDQEDVEEEQDREEESRIRKEGRKEKVYKRWGQIHQPPVLGTDEGAPTKTLKLKNSEKLDPKKVLTLESDENIGFGLNTTITTPNHPIPQKAMTPSPHNIAQNTMTPSPPTPILSSPKPTIVKSDNKFKRKDVRLSVRNTITPNHPTALNKVTPLPPKSLTPLGKSQSPSPSEPDPAPPPPKSLTPLGKSQSPNLSEPDPPPPLKKIEEPKPESNLSPTKNQTPQLRPQTPTLAQPPTQPEPTLATKPKRRPSLIMEAILKLKPKLNLNEQDMTSQPPTTKVKAPPTKQPQPPTTKGIKKATTKTPKPKPTPNPSQVQNKTTPRSYKKQKPKPVEDKPVDKNQPLMKTMLGKSKGGPDMEPNQPPKPAKPPMVPNHHHPEPTIVPKIREPRLKISPNPSLNTNPVARTNPNPIPDPTQCSNPEPNQTDKPKQPNKTKIKPNQLITKPKTKPQAAKPPPRGKGTLNLKLYFEKIADQKRERVSNQKSSNVGEAHPPTSNILNPSLRMPHRATVTPHPTTPANLPSSPGCQTKLEGNYDAAKG